MSNFDVVVVGGGLSGLCVGALLANAKKKVLVLEQQNQLGGRAFGTTYRGHYLDNGVHGPTRVGYLEEIFRRVGKPYPEIGPLYKRSQVYLNGKWQDINNLYSHQELRRIIQTIVGSSYEELERYDDISLKDWVSTQSDNEGIRYFFWYWGMAACVGNRFETFSAGDALALLKQHLDRWDTMSGVVGPIVGGMSRITQSLVDAITQGNGQIRTGVKISKIVIEERKVRGVEAEVGDKIIPSQVLDTELIEAPVVVIALPLWNLFEIISEDSFPRWYVEWIENIKHKISHVWTVIHATDQLLWDETTMKWVPELPRSKLMLYAMWFPTYGQPAGQYQAHFFTQGMWDELPSMFETNKAKTRNQIRNMLDLFEEDIAELFPDLREHSLWKVRQASAYGIAEAPGLVGKFRPSMRPPGIDNLILASDTLREARAPGGVQAAAKVALECADLILGKWMKAQPS